MPVTGQKPNRYRTSLCHDAGLVPLLDLQHGECEERGSESESKATLSTINGTGRRMTQMLVVVVVVVVVVVLLLLLLRI